MATHSSILAWGIPWTEEPGRLHSMGSQRMGHDLATKQQQEVGVVTGKNEEGHPFPCLFLRKRFYT